MSPKLFTSELNERAQEFKESLPVNVNLRFETLAPHIAYCEQTVFRPLLGGTLFDRLVDFYDDNQQSDDAAHNDLWTELLQKVQFALIRVSMWKGFDYIATNASDTGFSSAIDKDNRLFRYQEDNLRSALKNEGFDAMDDILAFLEEHLDVFEDFSQSKFHTLRDQTLIKDTAAFNDCYNINGSRLVFLKMAQFVRDFERISLCHRIGTDLFNELLTADETLPKYAAILPAIRMAVVYGAVAEGIGELHKMPTEKGLVFEANLADSVETKPVDHAQLMETRLLFAQKSDQYLASAIHHIKAHPSDYPNYHDFAGDSPADGVIHFDNTKRKNFLT